MLLVLVLDRGYSAVAGWAARTVAVLGVISMTALAIAMLARRGGAVGPVEPLYGDARFRGWAENPNQLALLLLTVPLMAVAFAAQGRPGRRVLWIGFGLMAIGLGVLTGSDALKAAWVALGALVAVFGWGRLALGPFARRVPTALLAIGAPIAIGVGVLAGGGRAVELSTEVIGETFAVGGQGEDRVGRWLFALDALEGSPAVGLGPGAFSGGSAPFQGQEAHNSVVDWAVSTGALGFAALLALTFGGALALALRRQRFSGAVGVSLVLFASLHYVFRQPLAWFLVFALFEGIFDRPREPEARRAD
jgi:O-antigen ligase